MKTEKRLALTLALAAMSSAALAEWIEIEKFDDGMRVYVLATNRAVRFCSK